MGRGGSRSVCASPLGRACSGGGHGILWLNGTGTAALLRCALRYAA